MYQRYGVSPSSRCYSPLIDYYCRMKRPRVDIALRMVEDMHHYRIRVSQHNLSPIIFAYCALNDPGAAEDLLRSMDRVHGVRPDEACYTPLVSYYVRRGNRKRAHELFQEMADLGLKRDSYVYTPMIRGAANFEEAFVLLHQLLTRDDTHCTSVYPFNSCMQMARTHKEAVAVVELMQQQRVRATAFTYSLMDRFNVDYKQQQPRFKLESDLLKTERRKDGRGDDAFSAQPVHHRREAFDDDDDYSSKY